jgi:hypothetical protein
VAACVYDAPCAAVPLVLWGAHEVSLGLRCYWFDGLHACFSRPFDSQSIMVRHNDTQLMSHEYQMAGRCCYSVPRVISATAPVCVL